MAMTDRQVTASAKRIVLAIVEDFNDKPNGTPSPQVIRAREAFGPAERSRAVKDIVALVAAAKAP